MVRRRDEHENDDEPAGQPEPEDREAARPERQRAARSANDIGMPTDTSHGTALDDRLAVQPADSVHAVRGQSAAGASATPSGIDRLADETLGSRLRARTRPLFP